MYDFIYKSEFDLHVTFTRPPAEKLTSEYVLFAGTQLSSEILFNITDGIEQILAPTLS